MDHLGRLRDDLPEVFETHILPQLSPGERTMLAYAGAGWHKTMRRLSERGFGFRIKISAVCESVDFMMWAKAAGCPWNVYTSKTVAASGNIEVLKWMRSRDPPCMGR
jgi:hypothetical protein